MKNAIIIIDGNNFSQVYRCRWGIASLLLILLKKNWTSVNIWCNYDFIFGSLFGPLGNLHLHYLVRSLRCTV